MEDERTLLEKLARGDRASFDALYMRYAAKTEEFLCRMLKNRAEAEDITHDLFLKIWQNRSMLAGVTAFGSYLFRMARNAVYDRFDSRAVRTNFARQTNLLPDVSTPYLMVVTGYPGASPERVESEVSDVLQNSLTVPGVSKITATSAENYSLLLMEFTEDTDMNSALVKVSNKLDQAKSDLPSTCLTPSIIEYSLNMNAFMTVAVSREGSAVYDLSDFVNNPLSP